MFLFFGVWVSRAPRILLRIFYNYNRNETKKLAKENMMLHLAKQRVYFLEEKDSNYTIVSYYILKCISLILVFFPKYM